MLVRQFPLFRVYSGGEALEVERMGWERYQYTYDEENKKIDKEEIGRFSQFPRQSRMGSNYPQITGDDARISRCRSGERRIFGRTNICCLV